MINLGVLVLLIYMAVKFSKPLNKYWMEYLEKFHQEHHPDNHSNVSTMSNLDESDKEQLMRSYNTKCKEAEAQLNLLSKFVQEDITSSGTMFNKRLLEKSVDIH